VVDVPQVEEHELLIRLFGILQVQEPQVALQLAAAQGGAAALPAIDGRFPYLLAVRDLASGYVLAWLPVTAAAAARTRAVLAQLFAQYGPPLLLKLDNGSAFRDADL
jgi:transposase InsO family protein